MLVNIFYLREKFDYPFIQVFMASLQTYLTKQVVTHMGFRIYVGKGLV